LAPQKMQIDFIAIVSNDLVLKLKSIKTIKGLEIIFLKIVPQRLCGPLLSSYPEKSIL
jgi:hypothetical protein